MKNYKVVIFDWDGTLMDSVGRIVDSMISAAKEVGVDVPSEIQVKNIIGLSLEVAIKILFPKDAVEKSDAIISAYKEFYLVKSNIETPLFENAYDLLQLLKNDGRTLAVATGKARFGLNRLLDISQTTHFFTASRCADEANSKPDPQMLNQLINELQVNADDVVMIGDTIHDLSMAQKAGVDSIGVTYGVHNKVELEKYAPVAIVHNVLELQSVLMD